MTLREGCDNAAAAAATAAADDDDDDDAIQVGDTCIVS